MPALPLHELTGFDRQFQYAPGDADPCETPPQLHRSSSTFGTPRPAPAPSARPAFSTRPNQPFPPILTAEERRLQDKTYYSTYSVLGRASQAHAAGLQEKREAALRNGGRPQERDTRTPSQLAYDLETEKAKAALAESIANPYPYGSSRHSSFDPPYSPFPPKSYARPTTPSALRRPQAQPQGPMAPPPPPPTDTLRQISSYSNLARPPAPRPTLPSLSTLGLLGDPRNNYAPAGSKQAEEWAYAAYAKLDPAEKMALGGMLGSGSSAMPAPDGMRGSGRGSFGERR